MGSTRVDPFSQIANYLIGETMKPIRRDKQAAYALMGPLIVVMKHPARQCCQGFFNTGEMLTVN